MCTWNAKSPIFLGNFTPKTSNYCLKNSALGFPGIAYLDVWGCMEEVGSGSVCFMPCEHVFLFAT